MFKIIHDKDAATKFVRSLDSSISKGAEKRNQWLSTPGGKFEGLVYYRKDLGIWAYIHTEIYINRYSCWFGMGEPDWRPAIEINIPVERTMHCYGQLVKEDDGEINLAHRGGLGGGKYSVKSDVFADLIRRFDRDEVQDGSRLLKYFVLGEADDPRTLDRLASYVKESVYIRQLREDEDKYQAAVNSAGGMYQDGDVLGGNFSDESQKAGDYYLHRHVTFRKTHARIQNELANKLKRRGIAVFNSRLHGGIGPDLYTVNENSTMKDIYEIKVGSDSQSMFTAIGQLIVYSSGAPNFVKKYLVTRGLPRSKLFIAALKALHVSVIRYELLDNGVDFEEINY